MDRQVGGWCLSLANLQLSFQRKPCLVENELYWNPEKNCSILSMKMMASYFTKPEIQ